MTLRQFLSAARPHLVVVVFALVGVALLAGAGLAYYVTITRPLAWPRASARIVASRVVNPVNPTQYQPEFVFELADGRGPRQVAVGAAWNSGSYDFVRAFVDRYPVGTTLDVAVNPDDADDLRYELGPTRANLILPGSLGVMGAIFVLCAVGTLMWRGPSASSAAASARTFRRVAALFIALGVGLGALGGWFWTFETALDWPEVEATVVEGVVLAVSSGSSRPSRAAYDIQVTFSYEVDGRPVTSRTTSGSSSSSQSAAAARLEGYAPGSRHRVRHRPDDPNVVRFEVSALRERALAGGLLGMGAVFTLLGGLLRRLLRRR